MTQEPVKGNADDYRSAQAEAKAAAARAKAMRPWYKKKRFLIGIPLAVFFILGLIGSLTETDEDSPTVVATSSNATTTESPGTSTPSGTSSAAAATESRTPVATQAAPESNLTASQRNAVRSAESYLSFTGFSRQGLIDQLSSEFGDQYPVQDATIAVDSLDVDWNAEAVESAEAYLSFSGFSCQGLIDQLSSDFGDQYTLDQATYAATQVGLC